MIQLVTPRARRILTVLESITDGSGPLDAFVEARCGDDPTVRRAVQVLAEARTEAGFGSEASFPSIARVFACAVTAASSRGDRLASVEGDAEADGVRSEVELLLDREDHLHVGDLFDALEGVADPERYLEPRDIPAGVRDRVLGVLAAAPMPTGPTPLLAPVISPLAEPYAGRVVQGLELEACIGTGGYGRVYRAWDPKFQRHLAVKILTAARDDSKMLLDEVQRASACAHPGVVTIHYVLEEGVDGLPTYAMEFMPGGSLAELLGERRRVAKDAAAQRATLPPSWIHEAILLVSRVAEALHAVHEQGFIHCDIKPGNILRDGSGYPKISDFGASKIQRASARVSTQGGQGTLGYMSPEQLRVLRHPTTRLSDIYSLGVVLYELLTLELPYVDSPEAPAPNPARAPLVPVTTWNPRVPRDLAVICHRALRVAPDERYPTAAAFAADLRRQLHHESPLAQPASATERFRDWRRRHPVANAMMVALPAVMLLTAMVLLGVQSQSDRRSRDAARIESEELRTLCDHLERRLRRAIAERPEALASYRPDCDSLLEIADRVRGPSVAAWDVADLGSLRKQVDGILTVVRDCALSLLTGRFSASGARLDPAERAGLEKVYQDTTARIGAGLVITLRTDPPGAQVTAIALDPVTERPIGMATKLLGTSPLQNVPLVPGFYALAARLDDRTAEIHRHIVGDVPANLPVLALTRVADARETMVPITTNLSVPLEEAQPDAYLGPRPSGRVEVSAFLIDRVEVTIGAYRRFLETHPGARVPRHWPKDPTFAWSADVESLPLTGLDVYAAEIFAASQGKRLPTGLEWQRAARGAEGREWPMDPAPTREQLVQSFVVSRDSTTSFEAFLRIVSPGAITPLDRTSEGVYDLYGNVSEWTSSVPWGAASADHWVPALTQRVRHGMGYRTPPLALSTRFVTPSQSVDPGIGFRCVKSLAP